MSSALPDAFSADPALVVQGHNRHRNNRHRKIHRNHHENLLLFRPTRSWNQICQATVELTDYVMVVVDVSMEGARADREVGRTVEFLAVVPL